MTDNAMVIVPHDAGVGAELGSLEESLLWAEVDNDHDFEIVDAGIEAIGRLAAAVSRADRADPQTQPLAPGGVVELGALTFVYVSRDDVARIQRLVELAESRPDVLADSGLAVAPADQVAPAPLARVAALVALPWDDDVRLLSQRLREGGRVELTEDEFAAFRRVTAQVIEVWFGGSALGGALERFAVLGPYSGPMSRTV